MEEATYPSDDRKDMRRNAPRETCPKRCRGLRQEGRLDAHLDAKAEECTNECDARNCVRTPWGNVCAHPRVVVLAKAETLKGGEAQPYSAITPRATGGVRSPSSLLANGGLLACADTSPFETHVCVSPGHLLVMGLPSVSFPVISVSTTSPGALSGVAPLQPIHTTFWVSSLVIQIYLR